MLTLLIKGIIYYLILGAMCALEMNRNGITDVVVEQMKNNIEEEPSLADLSHKEMKIIVSIFLSLGWPIFLKKFF